MYKCRKQHPDRKGQERVKTELYLYRMQAEIFGGPDRNYNLKLGFVGKVGCTVTRWMNQRHVSNPFPLTLSILMHKTHLSLSSLRFALTNLHRSVTYIFSKLLFFPCSTNYCETLHPNLLSHLFYFNLFIINDKYCLTISASYDMPHGSLF